MDIILFLGGLVLLFKKEVKISRKKTLSGSKVKVLAILYILPFSVGFLEGLIIPTGMINFQTISWITIPLVSVAVLTTLYFIFFYKEKGGEVT